MAIDYGEMEGRWQRAWNDAHVYESDPGEKPSALVTAAFPYVNEPQHIGHLRTYATADLYARYKRLRGFNVLYPMGFHATGTPILAIVKRLRNNDQELVNTLKTFEIPDDEIKKMEDPLYCANYIMRIDEEGMRLAGYGIDWRRKLKSIEPIFSKMVEWQFIKLKEMGLLKQGSHPVGWCTNEQNAVGQHDTKGDADPKIEELIAISFKDSESDAFFACATYRPETIDGVTNLFVGKGIDYVVARSGGKRYYMAKEAAEILSNQMEIEIEGPAGAEDLLKKMAINPSNGDVIPVLPGFFVKADVGTGIVMSVPAHAPFDYAALEALKREGYPIGGIEYRSVIRIDRPSAAVPPGELETARAGDPNVSAAAYLELIKGDPSPGDEVLERATKSVYREESHWGVMAVGKYAGKKEAEARGLISKDLLDAGSAFKMFELANEEPVFCRCGTRVVVKLVVGQWFINYGDEALKGKVKEYMNKMRFYPKGGVLTYRGVADWLGMRPAERAQGMGTRFPFNPEHIIESLSDSTIYMTLYTYINALRDADVKPEQLKPEFFDFVLLGRGGADMVAATTGIDAMVVRRCRESLEYWYNETSRHSGSDLIYNHLTMHIFIHLALFPETMWPKQVVTNGLVNYEGKKMSKSLGNIVPLKVGIRKYGADPLRFVTVASADLGTDTDFSVDGINSVRQKNDYLERLVLSLPGMKSQELSHGDYWLYSKLNSKIKAATACMDEMRIKDAYVEIYYNSVNELRRYMERGGSNELVLREFLEKIVIMMAPVMPHVAEELWHLLGKSTLVVQERWPEPDESMINREEEAIDDLIERTLSDIRQGIEMTSKMSSGAGKRVGRVEVIVAEDWKLGAYNALAEEKEIGKAMARPELKGIEREKLSKFMAQFAKSLNTMRKLPVISSESLLRGFMDARQYMAERAGAEIVPVGEADSRSARAGRARPDRPAIDIVRE